MNWLRNWCLRYLWNAVLPTDVLTADKHGLIYVNGVAITSEELAKMQSEVKFFEEMSIYKVLLGTPAEQAKKKLFEQATSWEDMVTGKMILYTLDIQQKVLGIIRHGKVVS